MTAQTATGGRVRIGGQALADGVLMRTNRAWAIARADGSIETGRVPENRLASVPVVRVIAGLFGGLKLGVVRGMLGRGEGARAGAVSRRLNARFLWVVAGLEVALVALPRFVVLPAATGVWSPLETIVPWALTLVALRAATPAPLWRYHGAEHKAVAAYESGADVADVEVVLRAPRVHDRCGTNLVFLMLAGSLLVERVPALWQVPALVLFLGVVVEALNLAAKRRDSVAARMLLSGGRMVQRYVTTAEPTPAEQAVGCAALLAALVEHERSLSEVGAGARVGALAAA